MFVPVRRCIFVGLIIIEAALSGEFIEKNATAADQESRRDETGERLARPKYGADAVRLYHRRDYLRQAAAPDYWALAPYYSTQRTGASCGLATAVMVLNALRADQDLAADESLISEARLLADLADDRWKRKTSSDGVGLTLQELAELLRAAASHYRLKGVVVDVVHVSSANQSSADALQQAFKENERSDRNFIVINFSQSRLTGDPEGSVGHFAPLAAFDAQKQATLILDPDRQWYEPYWSPLGAVLEAMATRDNDAGRFRGYLWIRRGD